MKSYIIKIIGCDDTTYILIKDISDDEIHTIRYLADLSKEISRYSCEPIIEIVEEDDLRPDLYKESRMNLPL